MLTFKKSAGVAGSTEVIQLMRLSPNGGYEPYEGQFDGSEELHAELWPGEDRAATATIPSEWLDAAAGTVSLHFPLSLTQSLEPGTHQGSLHLADRSAHLAAFSVQVVFGAGEAVARPKYGTLQDLENELPWVQDLFTEGADQTQFADALADARDFVDAIIVNSAPRRSPAPNPLRFGSNTFRDDVAEALAADALLTTTPNGKRLIKVCVYHALSQILRRCAGRREAEDLVSLSHFYDSKANNTIQTCLAEIDRDGDGWPEIRINLGVTSTR